MYIRCKPLISFGWTIARRIAVKKLIDYFKFNQMPMQTFLDSQKILGKYCELVEYLDEMLPDGPEKTVCFRKLLESKDCALRSFAQDVEGESIT